jgi:hypothetical protein
MRRASEDRIIVWLGIALAFWTLLGLPLVQAFSAAQYQATSDESFWARAQHDPEALFTLWVAIFTGLLVVATAVYAASTIYLWRTTQEGFKGQSEETRIIQRAYIGAEPHGIREHHQPNKAVAYIRLHNAGRLPASNLSYYIKLLFSDHWPQTIPGPPSNWSVGKNDIYGPFVVAAGSDIILGTDEFEEAYLKMTEKRKYLHVWGRVQYDDGFGQMCYTNFCHRYNLGWVERPVAEKLAPSFGRQHEYGNDAGLVI